MELLNLSQFLVRHPAERAPVHRPAPDSSATLLPKSDKTTFREQKGTTGLKMTRTGLDDSIPKGLYPPHALRRHFGGLTGRRRFLEPSLLPELPLQRQGRPASPGSSPTSKPVESLLTVRKSSTSPANRAGGSPSLGPQVHHSLIS